MIALFFDTETTGFRSPQFTPEIVQIGAILQDTETRQVFTEINLLVQPFREIPRDATTIHGITTNVARKFGVSSDSVKSVFLEMLRCTDILVAHNIDFDLDMLRTWYYSFLDEELEDKVLFDTMHELTPIMKLPKTGENYYHDDKYPEWKAPKLKEAYKHYFGKEFENQHDAMADVRACRDVYFAMHRSKTRAGK